MTNNDKTRNTQIGLHSVRKMIRMKNILYS